MYTEQVVAKEGKDLKAYVWAAGLGLAAAVCIYLGVTQTLTLAIRRFVLPHWSMYVVAVGLLGMAALMAMTAASRYCLRCGGMWEGEDAYFPLEMRDAVTRAVRDGDVAALRKLPMVPKNQMKMHLNVVACGKCGETGEATLYRWEDFHQHTDLETRNMQGPGSKAMLELAHAHAEARGEDND